MLEFLLYTCILLFGMYVLFGKLRRATKNGKPIPGPKGYPFIGNAMEVKPETLHEKFAEYASEFGGIFQVKMFNSRMVSINTADLVRKAFAEEPHRRAFNDRDYFFFSDYIHYGGQTIGSWISGNDSVHSGMRKGIIKAMHVYGDGVKAFEERFATEMDRLVREVNGYHGQGFKFETVMRRSLSNLISILMIGEGVADEDIDIFSRYDTATDFFVNPRANSIMSTFPFIRFVPGTYKRNFDNVVAARNGIKEKYVDDILATYKPGTIRGIIDSLYSQQLDDVAAGRTVVHTYERIVCAATELVVAGIQTSLSTLCNMMLCLLYHPRYQKKVQQELDDVIGRDRKPSLADKARCPWVEAVLLETLRLIPTQPFLCPHFVKENTVFEGYNVEKGSTVLGNYWSIAHDEKIYGDPWSFRPERFLDDHGQLVPRDSILRKNLFPFSIGRRVCIGEGFARSRLFVYAATMLQRWTFSPIPGMVGPWDPRETEHFEVRLMMCAKEYHCRVEERK